MRIQSLNKYSTCLIPSLNQFWKKDFISSFSKKKTKGLLRSLFQDVIKGWKFSNLSIRFENNIRKEYQARKFEKQKSFFKK
jgi:hypothetical protein